MTDDGTVSRHNKGEAIWNPQVGHELDLLTRARDRLVELDKGAVDGPWEAEFTTPTMGGETWRLRTKGVPGIRLSVVEYQHGPHNAGLIAALRGCAPYLIKRLNRAIGTQAHASNPELYNRDEIELAKVILS